MEMPIPDPPVTYGKDTLFDLEAGMPVYGPAGAKIGIVTEVAGFGSTHLGPVPPHGVDDRVTQAQTGTGYFKVKREAVEDTGTPDLCIPFHVVQEVTSGHGVILNATFVAELQLAGDPVDAGIPSGTATRSARWGKWLSRKKA
jgi:hypothetical protein